MKYNLDNRRLKVQLMAKYKSCVICSERDWSNLVVHHLTYKRAHHERLSDVTLLCIKCHNHFHNNYAKGSDPDLGLFTKLYIKKYRKKGRWK